MSWRVDAESAGASKDEESYGDDPFRRVHLAKCRIEEYIAWDDETFRSPRRRQVFQDQLRRTL